MVMLLLEDPELVWDLNITMILVLVLVLVLQHIRDGDPHLKKEKDQFPEADLGHIALHASAASSPFNRQFN